MDSKRLLLFYVSMLERFSYDLEKYEAVLVSKLWSHFIELILHFMLYFSHLMLNQLHFHTVLRIDSVRIYFEKVLWFFQ